MQSNVCNIRPVFLFLTAHHFSLAKQQHLHQDVHAQQQTTKSEQITMTEAIYRLQRATVASWHCLALCACCASQDLLRRTAQQPLCL